LQIPSLCTNPTGACRCPAPPLSLIDRVSPALLACPGPAASAAQAQEKFTYTTNWYAQAEHGGFYQAVATGLYKRSTAWT
jgi:NitT/TauT family transport system substrate-binding protein